MNNVKQSALGWGSVDEGPASHDVEVSADMLVPGVPGARECVRAELGGAAGVTARAPHTQRCSPPTNLRPTVVERHVAWPSRSRRHVATTRSSDPGADAHARACMVRLLCLHGAASNSGVTRLQLEVLGLTDPADAIEVDCLEAPFPAPAGSPAPALGGAGRSWLGHAESAAEASAELETSLRHVVAHAAAHGPYDGAFGFSQGAAVLTLLSDAAVCATLGWRHSEPPWRFAVLACGVDLSYYCTALADRASPSRLTLPSLHIIGSADGLRGYSEGLLARFDNPRALRHPWGHSLPIELAGHDGGRLVAAVRAFILSSSQRGDSSSSQRAEATAPPRQRRGSWEGVAVACLTASARGLRALSAALPLLLPTIVVAIVLLLERT